MPAHRVTIHYPQLLIFMALRHHLYIFFKSVIGKRYTRQKIPNVQEMIECEGKVTVTLSLSLSLSLPPPHTHPSPQALLPRESLACGMS
jgi:hypothetical protein